MHSCWNCYNVWPTMWTMWKWYCSELLVDSAILIHTGKSGDWDKTVQIFDALQDSKLKPDVWTYTSLINACQSCGNDWQSGIEVFQDMEFQGKNSSALSSLGNFEFMCLQSLSLCLCLKKKLISALFHVAIMSDPHLYARKVFEAQTVSFDLSGFILSYRHCLLTLSRKISSKLRSVTQAQCKHNQGRTKLPPAHV